MSGEKYVLSKGEHISSVAAANGFGHYDLIWDLPANAKLREQRTDPHQLLPGDALVIPERAPIKIHKRATGAVHSFAVNVEKLKLRVKLLDFNGKALSGETVTLTAGGRTEVSADADGVVTSRIPRDCTHGELELGGESFELAVGELGPIADAESQAARLLNLGFWYGDDDELHDPAALALATELFQREQGLEVTGELDDASLRKLNALHDGKE